MITKHRRNLMKCTNTWKLNTNMLLSNQWINEDIERIFFLSLFRYHACLWQLEWKRGANKNKLFLFLLYNSTLLSIWQKISLWNMKFNLLVKYTFGMCFALAYIENIMKFNYLIFLLICNIFTETKQMNPIARVIFIRNMPQHS